MPKFSEKPKSQHCEQVMFLSPTTIEHDICMAFNDYGNIFEAHIIQSRREHNMLNYFSINFKVSFYKSRHMKFEPFHES